MSDFYSRQDFHLNRELISPQKILVVGCGAIGRNVASMIGRLGPSKIVVIDHDTIDDVNISPQNFLRQHIGHSKCEVVCEEIQQQLSEDSETSVISINERWTPALHAKDKNLSDITTVFCCVDSIETRKTLFEYVFSNTTASYFFDVRIGGFLAQIFSVNFDNLEMNPEFDENGNTANELECWYQSTLFSPKETASFGCVQPMSNYVANIASGTAVNQYSNTLNGRPTAKLLEYETVFCSMTKINDEQEIAEKFK